MPVVRTFAPVVAGVGAMQYRRFLMFNLIGAVLWAIGITLAGYYLGNLVPDVDKYLLPIIGAIVFVSILPGLKHILLDAELRASLIKSLGRKSH